MQSTVPQPMRLGVFGNEGSFSEAAGLAWLEQQGRCLGRDAELRHVADLSGLLLALHGKRVECAILPVVNSSAGLVLPAFEALGRHAFRPVGELTLAVEQCLCLRDAEVDVAGILAVVSHPHALAQCRAGLEERLPGTERVAWSDTASAARDLAVGVLPAATSAVVCSRGAAERFGLHCLATGIQDDPHNRTTFLIVERTE